MKKYLFVFAISLVAVIGSVLVGCDSLVPPPQKEFLMYTTSTLVFDAIPYDENLTYAEALAKADNSDLEYYCSGWFYDLNYQNPVNLNDKISVDQIYSEGATIRSSRHSSDFIRFTYLEETQSFMAELNTPFELSKVVFPARYKDDAHDAKVTHCKLSRGRNIEEIIFCSNVKVISDEKDILYSSTTKFNLPEGLEEIANDCFSLLRITEIELPSTLSKIGEEAFSSCYFTSISLPSSITDIGDGAFSSCDDLVSITIEENENYMVENNVLYTKDKSKLICYPAGLSATTYTAPNSVTSIGKHTFYFNPTLTTINLNNVTGIPLRALAYCQELTQVSIPEVTYIDIDAFYNSSKLATIRNMDKVETIRTNSFVGTVVSSVELPDTFRTLEAYAFSTEENEKTTDTALTYISIPHLITHLEPNSFKNCTKLEVVNFTTDPEDNKHKIQNIGASAFQNCTALLDFSAPDSLTTIGTSAFKNCKAMKSFIAHDDCSLITISYEAFLNCKELSYIYLPNTLRTIDAYAFYNCRLDDDGAGFSLNIPASVTTVGGYAFSRNSTTSYPKRLQSVTIHNPNLCVKYSENSSKYVFNMIDAYDPLTTDFISIKKHSQVNDDRAEGLYDLSPTFEYQAIDGEGYVNILRPVE